jgi:hypothetical protein
MMSQFGNLLKLQLLDHKKNLNGNFSYHLLHHQQKSGWFHVKASEKFRNLTTFFITCQYCVSNLKISRILDFSTLYALKTTKKLKFSKFNPV